MRLTLQELAFLKDYYKTMNELSIFANIKKTGDGVSPEELEKKLVLQGGKVGSAWDRLLKAAAEPLAATRLLVRDGGFLVEKYSYKDAEGFTLVENQGAQLEFTRPESLEAQMLGLSRWIGMSNLSSLDFEADLSAMEALALLGLADLGRQAVFGGFLREPVAVKTDRSNLEAQLGKPAANSLLSILLNNYELKPPEGDVLDGVLASLVEKKLISLEGGRIALSDSLASLAGNILVPQTVLLVENAEFGEGGSIVAESYLAVTAGVKEVLLFTLGGGKIRLEAVSSQQLLKLVESLLRFRREG